MSSLLPSRVAEILPGAFGGTPPMARGSPEDVLHAADVLGVLPNGAAPEDPLDARDPDYIRETLPSVRMSAELYFRGEVRGLEHIPADGPVLLVGNHSGGTLIADTFVFAEA